MKLFAIPCCGLKKKFTGQNPATPKTKVMTEWVAELSVMPVCVDVDSTVLSPMEALGMLVLRR